MKNQPDINVKVRKLLAMGRTLDEVREALKGELALTKAQFQQDYYKAIAKNDGPKAAVAISELQHPLFTGIPVAGIF